VVTGRRPAVFLDRDGVLNNSVVRDGKPYPPQNLDELEVMPGAAQAVSQLKAAGFVTVIVTNQPDVAKGKQTREMVDAINHHVMAETGVDHLYVCWCVEGDDCDCYKPKPGMLLAAARDHGLDLSRSYMVGDRWRDVGAGQNAGCKTLFIDWGYDEPLSDVPDAIVAGISEVPALVLSFEENTH
jgi:D-glycero-D-manno-heptose 1,7-bisphosphate phosphatase